MRSSARLKQSEPKADAKRPVQAKFSTPRSGRGGHNQCDSNSTPVIRFQILFL